MKLVIEQKDREGVQIVDLKGRLTVGESASQLREYIERIGNEGYERVVLNLNGVEYIDSTGLGTLVICYTTLQKAGGKLKLLNLTRRNIELLVLTKLTTIFEIYTDEQDAVNSFFPNREIKRFDILNFVQQAEGEER